MYLRMLVFSDLQHLSVPSQFFVFSDAYLDSAVFLCDALCNNAQELTYAHGAATMSLTFHSIELFLKGAILLKTPSAKFSGNSGHNLSRLYNTYTTLYKDKSYEIDFPFMCKPPETEDLDPRLAEELLSFVQDRERKLPEDQIHRYPADKNGKPWEAILGFEPHSFREVLKKLREDLVEVRAMIAASQSQKTDS